MLAAPGMALGVEREVEKIDDLGELTHQPQVVVSLGEEEVEEVDSEDHSEEV